MECQARGFPFESAPGDKAPGYFFQIVNGFLVLTSRRGAGPYLEARFRRSARNRAKPKRKSAAVPMKWMQ
jgi:hypothetical protein